MFEFLCKFLCKWKQNEKNEKLLKIRAFNHYKKYNSDRKKQTSYLFEKEKKFMKKWENNLISFNWLWIFYLDENKHLNISFFQKISFFILAEH